MKVHLILRMTFLLFVVWNISFITCENHQNEANPQSYNFVRLVQDASSRLSKVKEVQKLFNGRNASEINEFLDIIKRNVEPLLIDYLSNYGSGECIHDLVHVFLNLRTLGGFSQQMIDSFGKPESGLFQGNYRWLGAYSECVQIYVPSDPSGGNGNFHTNYCTLQVPVHLMNNLIPLSFGVCLPESCGNKYGRKEKLPNGLDNLPQMDEKSKSMFGNITLTCQPTSKEFSAAGNGMIFLISIFAVLALIGSSLTVFEHFTKGEDHTDDKIAVNGDIDRRSLHGDGDDELLIYAKQPKSTLPGWLQKCKPFFNCFCIFTNGEKLLSTASPEGQLPSLHGIRFLSLSWVIVCHTYAFCFNYINNVAELGKYIDNWPFQIILNGFYSVDSFFLLSGFLVAYLFFEQAYKSHGKFPWIYFYVHRYIRLTPVYMIVLGFVTAIQPFIGSGPLWPTSAVDPVCKKGWWWNILYINNFQPNQEVCMAWSWYLANDMQFFVLSPIFLITLWRWPVIGYATIAQFLLVTFVSNFVITNEYNLVAGLGSMATSGPEALAYLMKFMTYFDKIYVKPYTRMSPYLVGIALAFYLYRRKLQNKGKNSFVFLTVGWLIATTVTLACLFGQYHQNFSTLESAFYNAFNRFCFACGLAWVMYVCITGQASFVNSILSYKLFIPLSRLTYCAYLVHPIVQMGYFAALKNLIHFNHLTMVLLYLGFLILSYSAALVTSLLFESPIIRLDKFVRTKFSGRS